MPSFTFYMSSEDAAFWERFASILKREGSNRSEHLSKHIIEYVERHDPGNPQTRITSHLDMDFTNASDLVALEGKIREVFYSRAARIGDLQYSDIVKHCKDHFNDGRRASSMARRVEKWLKEKGVRIWN